MATYDSDILAEGALTTEASLYSPGGGVYLANGGLVYRNTGGSTRVVTTKIQKASGTARVVDVATLLTGETRMIEGIHLGPSDDLRALQDSGTDVTYVLMGGAGA